MSRVVARQLEDGSFEPYYYDLDFEDRNREVAKLHNDAAFRAREQRRHNDHLVQGLKDGRERRSRVDALRTLADARDRQNMPDSATKLRDAANVLEAN